jgi:hypothetical protein
MADVKNELAKINVDSNTLMPFSANHCKTADYYANQAGCVPDGK